MTLSLCMEVCIWNIVVFSLFGVSMAVTMNSKAVTLIMLMVVFVLGLCVVITLLLKYHQQFCILTQCRYPIEFPQKKHPRMLTL